MRVLIIASGADLDLWSEIDAIEEMHEVTIIADAQATVANIFEKVRGRKYDILHIASHFDGRNFILASDEKLTRHHVAMLAKNTRVKLAYLNGCGTILMSPYLVQKHIPAVISNADQPWKKIGEQLEIDDEMAKINSAIFYDEINRNNGNLRKAFDDTNTYDGRLHWNSNGDYLDEAVKPIAKKLETVDARLRVFEQQGNQHKLSIEKVRSTFCFYGRWTAAILLIQAGLMAFILLQ